MKKIKNFFKGVGKEAKVVRWPDGKTLAKYSCVTIFLLIFFGLFFMGLNYLFPLIPRIPGAIENLFEKIIEFIKGLF